MTYNDERIVQVLDYLASGVPGKRLSKLTALKLVYLADRYHLRKYAAPILWDTYYAMKYGPVASRTKALIETACRDTRFSRYISVRAHSVSGREIMYITSLAPCNGEQISKTEREALDAALAQWPLHDDLVAFTHRFPEWRLAKARLDNGANRVRMPYADFFLPCKAKGVEYCDVRQSHVDLNKAVFEEELERRF